MRYLARLGWWLAIAWTTGVAAAEVSDNKFNVLFVAVDDLRPELGCYGVSYARTPHLDRFATRALRFDKHYVCVPTCGASRYAMLTGRSPKSTGITSGNNGFYSKQNGLSQDQLPGAQTMPELFRRSGYKTCLLGKISHTADGRVFSYDAKGDGRPEMPHAWDQSLTPMGTWERGWGIFFAYANGRHREDGSGYQPLLEFQAEDDDALPDGMIASAAIQQLKRYHASGDRFFMGVGFFKPHLPFVAPKQDWDAFESVDIPLPSPEKIASPYYSKSGEFYRYDTEYKKTHPLSDDAIRTAKRGYLACVRYADRQIGRLLATLEQLELHRNTVVVVWGDHGWHLGEQQVWAKHTPFERATRSVLMISQPGLRTAGKMSHSLTSAIDLYPTMVELCNPSFRATRYPVEGRSLVPILRHERTRTRDVAVSYWRKAISVRDDQYRLIRTEDGSQPDELYDVREDPDSIKNLATESPEICERLATAAGL